MEAPKKSHKKGKPRPPKWGPVMKGTGPTLEEIFGPDWLTSKGSFYVLPTFVQENRPIGWLLLLFFYVLS